MMAAFVHAQELDSKLSPRLSPLRTAVSQGTFQDVRTPTSQFATGMTMDSHLMNNGQSASLEHLLAHLESSKRALEHQVQQLLQENRLSKSGKKDNQWQMERERLLSDLDTASISLVEKEDRICRLEKELRDARTTMEQVQNRYREGEREKERRALERESMQADLEDAQMAIQKLERDCQLKRDISEKQRRALDSLTEKMEIQKEFFQCQLEEEKLRVLTSEEREQKHQLATQVAMQKLGEKERQLASLRDAHEKLLSAHKGRHADDRQEVEEVLYALETSQAKCDEQNSLLNDMEQELGKARSEAHQLEVRLSNAEAEAIAKASSLEQMHLELVCNTGHLTKAKAQAEELKSQMDASKRTLKEVENTLSEESALRFTAECALNEYKQREKCLLKVEQDSKALQEEVKWRNEQFQSLEEAHSRLRDQFQEGRSMWASEKTAMLKDIELLQDNVQSKEILLQDLRAQLKHLHQSLAHEENCRKLVEFQLADAKAGMESASQEFEAAQSVLESLRENSKKELAFLRDALSAKERQLLELQVQCKQNNQEQQEVKEMEVELQKYKSSYELLQQALEMRAEENISGKELGVEIVRNTESDLQEETEYLMQRLSDAEAIIVSKDVEVKELEMELDRARTLTELLRASMADLEQKHQEEKNEVLCDLEHVTKSLLVKDNQLKELEAELARLQVFPEDVHKLNLEADAKFTQKEESPEAAQREAKEVRASTLAIADHRHVCVYCDQKDDVDRDLLDAVKHEEVIVTMQAEYEGLQQLMNNCELSRVELGKDRDMLIAEVSKLKKQWHEEKEELLFDIKQFEKQSTEKEEEMKMMHDELSRQQELVSTLKARCLTCDQQLMKQSLLAERVQEELVTERLKAKTYKERAQILDESLTAESVARGTSFHEIKEYLHDLTILCKGGSEAATSHTLRISSIEEKLQQQQHVQGSMEERMLSMKGELNQTVGKVERVTHGVDCLHTELQSLQTASKSTKGEFERRLRLLEDMFSTSCMELMEVTGQLEKMSAERITLLQDLEMKEVDLDDLRKVNECLDSERSKLESTAKELEERMLMVVREAESSKGLIEKLSSNLEVAEAGLVLKTVELHDLHGKLENAESKGVQLKTIEARAHGLENKLRQAEASVHDKEAKLAASEWTVQQLASEIAKSKSLLAQKEKDDVVLQDQISQLNRQLNGKERELAELQCDLDNALNAGSMKQAVVQEFSLAKDGLVQKLDLAKSALEEKVMALSASEAEVQRLTEMQRLMESALETVKERVVSETNAKLALEREMEHLCHDTERSKQEANMAEDQVKELQGRLQHLERSTEARLQSCERKMEKGAADLLQYKENCAALLELIERKDTALDELEAEVEVARKELVKQAMLIEHGTQELKFAKEQLQSKVEMHSSLNDELATTDDHMRQLRMQKQELEEEIRGLKGELTTATKELSRKSLEIEKQRHNFERLETLSSQQESDYSLISKELQTTSYALEEQENSLSKLQSALNVAHDDLRVAYEKVSTKEGERQILVGKLSEMERLVEQNQKQISQLQKSLQRAQSDLEAETERVWYHVAAKNEIQIELNSWKEKGASVTFGAKEDLDGVVNQLQAEVKEWKGKAEQERFLHLELEQSMQVILQDWESNAMSLADEGRSVKLEMDTILSELHREFQALKKELMDTVEVVAHAGRDGRNLKAQLESYVKASQTEVEVWRERTATAVIAGEEEKLFFEDSTKQLQNLITNLQDELKCLEVKAAHAPDAESLLKEKNEISLKEVHSELFLWKHKAEELASFNKTMEQFMLEFETALSECKLDAASVVDVGRNMKSDLENSFQSMLKEVEATKAEVLELKEIVAIEAEETRYVQLELERCVSTSQAEVKLWKERAAMAAEEGSEMREQYEYLLRNLQGELKTWRQFEALAQEEGQFGSKAASEVVVLECDSGEAEPEVDKKSLSAANITESMNQEPETCLSGGQDPNSDQAHTQAHAQRNNQWKERAAISAKEGRLLTEQFRKSFKHLQIELGNRKHPLATMKDESTVTKEDNPGLESLVQALQEEALVIKAELTDWKEKAASAVDEAEFVKNELDRTIIRMKAEVEGWKDRAAMSAGQGIVARRQLEDFAKQVKLLQREVQEWKELSTEVEEESSKLRDFLGTVQKDNDVLKAELLDWKQKAVLSAKEVEGLKLEYKISIKDLQGDLDRWKQIAASSSEEGRKHIEELQCCVFELQAEVEKWQKVAVTAEEERKSTKLELLDTLDKLEDELEVWNGDSAAGSGMVEGIGLKEDELGHLVDRKQGTCEAGISLESEIEDWKLKAFGAEKKERDLRQQFETAVKELQLEVEAWKKSAACIAEDGRLVRLELEKRMKELQEEDKDVADHIVHERKRTSTELAELQTELRDWKVIAADAAEECTSLRVAYDNIMKDLHSELAQWKDKAEEASAEGMSVKAELEKVVEELQSEVVRWREKAEEALEGIVEKKDYIDAVSALEVELCLWKGRAKEGESLHLQLQEEQLKLANSLVETQTELQKWQERSAAVTLAVESLQAELVNVIEEGTSDRQDNMDSVSTLQSELEEWKAKAEEGELVQVQLKSLLIETQSELQDWKQKAAAVTLATESLKEELDCVIEEGRLEKEELLNSISTLEAGICGWRNRDQECESLQLRLDMSQAELQEWKDKAAAVVLTTKSLMEELDFTIEEGFLEKQEFCNSITSLRASVLGWKEKAKEGESLNSQLKSALRETQAELRDWKERTAAVAIATKSLKGEMDCTLEDNRLEKMELFNSISVLEAELSEWKARAQEGVSVQQELERTLVEMEEKAAATALDTQALKEELDCIIGESTSEIHELCNSITILEAELLEWKDKAQESYSPDSQLDKVLTETRIELLEWKDKATAAFATTSHLREELDCSGKESRSQIEEFCEAITDLKEELSEWKQKAEQVEALRLELAFSLTATQTELQEWKQKAVAVSAASESAKKESGELDSWTSLEAELCEWRQKAEEGEFLQLQLRSSLSETQLELQDLREKSALFTISTESLREELDNATETVSVLMTRLSSQKENEASLQRLNWKLETDLALVREEAIARKEKMTQILSQLESTHISQKELQGKLLLASNRLLANGEEYPEGHYLRTEGMATAMELDRTVFNMESEDICDAMGGITDVKEEGFCLRSQHHRSKSETQLEVTGLRANLSQLPGRNLAVDQLKQELSSLKSLVSKLGHVREGDVQGSYASNVPGDGEIGKVPEKDTTQEQLGENVELCASLLRENEELQKQVNGLQRRNRGLQKQVESLQATVESNLQRKATETPSRTRLSSARFNVLTDVDGNSPLVTAMEKAQFDVIHSPFTPDQPMPRKRTTSDSL